MNKSNTSVYMERKLEGLCTRCGTPAAEDSTLCQEHREDLNRRAAECMKRKRDDRRARGECIEGCGRKVVDDYVCANCRIKIDRYKRAWISGSVEVVNNEVHKSARIAARTVVEADGRTRYRGQSRRGQQTHAQLNIQDLGWARDSFDAFAAGVKLLSSDDAKHWRREERDQVVKATASQGERAGRHMDDILERMGHFKSRHGRRDGE